MYSGFFTVGLSCIEIRKYRKAAKNENIPYLFQSFRSEIFITYPTYPVLIKLASFYLLEF